MKGEQATTTTKEQERMGYNQWRAQTVGLETSRQGWRAQTTPEDQPTYTPREEQDNTTTTTKEQDGEATKLGE